MTRGTDPSQQGLRSAPKAVRAVSLSPGRALSLLEVLVVISMISLLASILLPALAAAREQAKGIACRSNVQQIFRANLYYAQDNGVYCPGAADFLANLDRWHGRRDRPNEAFDSARGPLVPYLGPEGAIRQCPAFPAEEIAQRSGGFERGCGGYGYNNAYVGVQLRRFPSGEYAVVEERAGAFGDRIRRPVETLMFADAAFAANGLIEYSFAEPRFHVQFPAYRHDPSIQFRHRGWANVAWCDGHVDARELTFTWSSGLYTGDPKRLSIGWFGHADDNGYFDLD